jgi:hypothetical protein
MDNEINIKLATWNIRWMDQVEEDLKRMKIVGWRAKVEDRQERNRTVEQIKTHPGLYSQ